MTRMLVPVTHTEVGRFVENRLADLAKVSSLHAAVFGAIYAELRTITDDPVTQCLTMVRVLAEDGDRLLMAAARHDAYVLAYAFMRVGDPQRRAETLGVAS